MHALRKYTLFLTKIHGFAFIFSFLLLGATPQLSEVLAEDTNDEIKSLRTPLDPIAIEGEYLVQFTSDKPLNNIKNGKNPAWVSKLGTGVKIDTELSKYNIAHIRVANPASTGQWENLANTLSSDPSIAHVEPNYMVHSMRMPNDPKVSDMWSLQSISAFKAWDQAKQGKEVIVAVIDTGIQIDHEDLIDHIWSNEKEIAGNGKDDDGNGYPDDSFGWNFYDGNHLPYSHLNSKPFIGYDPDKGRYACHGHPTAKKYEVHGSHVAGIIAAMGNNHKGIIGVANNVKIMPVKALGGPCSSGDSISILKAVAYAVDNGARIINMSIGSYGSLRIAESFYQYISDRGVLIVASAGNESHDNDYPVHSFPASHKAAGILSVAASGPDDQLARFSNFGEKSVDIAAPGVRLLSTIPAGKDTVPLSSYVALSGTSMAAPVVSGAAAFLLSQNPNLTNIELKKRLMDSVDKVPALTGKLVSGGRLNLYKALSQSSRIASTPNRPDRKTTPSVSAPQMQSVGGIRIYDKRKEKQKW